uniref:Uncharacterized protein n=1 Tax=Meloidogyne enterolobii TaxID=390850 RepID=A0A6V7WT62_MELEN|nr:unnamed protein product [Meloidogyne enterolobii]
MYKKYLNNKSNTKNNYTLNERYRQLENVYTGKQLAPSFNFQFINILSTSILVVIINFLQNEVMNNVICFYLIIHAICKLGTCGSKQSEVSEIEEPETGTSSEAGNWNFDPPLLVRHLSLFF